MMTILGLFQDLFLHFDCYASQSTVISIPISVRMSIVSISIRMSIVSTIVSKTVSIISIVPSLRISLRIGLSLGFSLAFLSAPKGKAISNSSNGCTYGHFSRNNFGTFVFYGGTMGNSRKEGCRGGSKMVGNRCNRYG